MTGYVPESGGQFIRDYLYVNVDRVKSLLAQFASGSPETVTRSEQRQKGASVNISIVNASLSLSRGEQYSSSLKDLAFAIMEDAAEELGFLREISDVASNPKRWKRGTLAKVLSAGSIFRVTGPIRIIDARTLTTQLGKWQKVMDDDDLEFAQALELAATMYGDSVTVRCFPAGEDEPTCNFSGTLDGAEAALDRSSLLSRYGGYPAQWTMVAQVSYVPNSGSPTRASVDMNRVIRGGQVDRVEFEKVFAVTIAELMASGMSEAPNFPAMSVIPLGIYRVVRPYDPGIADDGDD